MIEINLLPPQYRTVERTPLPVFLSLIAGIVLIGLSFVLLMVMVRQTQVVEERRGKLVQDHEQKRKEAEAVDQLEKDILDARGRIDTILGIAESKIPWAVKLNQLARICPPYIWIDTLAMAQKPDGSGELRLQCNASGTNLERFTSFRRALRNDTNFFYHFDDVITPAIDPRSPGKEYLVPTILSFTMTLPFRQVEAVGGGPPTRR